LRRSSAAPTKTKPIASGLELTARAGYRSARRGQPVAENDQGQQRGQAPAFLSSHPTDASRVQQIEALLPTVMPFYAAARRGG